MTDLFDSTPERDATEEELRRYNEARGEVNNLDYEGTYSGGANERLYVISFDGTRNDRYSSDPDNVHTNTDVLEKLIPDTDQVESRYISGVGTDSDIGPLQRTNEAITGNGLARKAEHAYDEFLIQVQQWHAENPNVEIHVSTVGFSRGTGSQRHFANLVEQLGIPNPDGDGYLIPPGGVHQDAMLMHDSVLTGQEDQLMTGVPASVKNVAHLTANDENRMNFDSVSVVDPLNPNDPGIFEFGLPGAHSDIGGNYEDPEGSPFSDNQFGNGLSARVLSISRDFLVHSGVPLDEIPPEYRVDPNNITIHDSGSLLEPAYWEHGEREICYPGNPDRYGEDDTIVGINEDGSHITFGDLKEQLLVEQHQQAQIDEVNNLVQQAELQRSALASNQRFLDSLSDGARDNVVAENILTMILSNEGLNDHRDGDGSEGMLDSASGRYLQSLESAFQLYNTIHNPDAPDLQAVGSLITLIDDLDDTFFSTTDANLTVHPEDGAGMDGYVPNNWASGLVSTLNTVESWDELSDLERANSLVDVYESYAGTNSAGKIGSAVGLAVSLDHGDEVGAAISGVQLAGSAGSQTAASVAPYLAYADAVARLADGATEGAAYSAASAYLMATGPYGWVAALALMVIGGEAMAPPDPEADLWFTQNPDGSIGYSAWSNETGGKLSEILEAQGDSILEMLGGLEASMVGLPGGKLDPGALPEINVTRPLDDNDASLQWSLSGGKHFGSAVQMLDEGDQDILRALRDMTIISHLSPDMIVGHRTVNDIGQTIYSPFGYPLAGGANVVNVAGTGVFVGGGNVNPLQGLVYTEKQQGVVSASNRETPVPLRELQQIMDAQIVPKGLFTGQQGQLLAMAVGAGAISLSDLALADGELAQLRADLVELEDSNIDIDEYIAEWTEGSGNVVGVDEVGSSTPGTLKYVADGSVSSVDTIGNTNNGLGGSSPPPADFDADTDNQPDTAGSQSSEDGNSGQDASDVTFADSGDNDEESTGNNDGETSAGADNEPGIDSAGEESLPSQVESTSVDDLVNPLPEPVEFSRSPDVSGQPDRFSMLEDRSIYFMANDLLENDGDSTFLRLGPAQHGTAMMDGAGKIVFTPDANYADTFQSSGANNQAGFYYWIENEAGDEQKVWAEIDVANVRDNPDAKDDTFTSAEDTRIELNTLLTANDLGVDGVGVSIIDVSSSLGGVEQQGENWLYTPRKNYVGDVQLVYTVQNLSGQTAVARANMTITDDGVDAPVVSTDDLDGLLGKGVEEQDYRFTTENLLENDTDPGGVPLSVTSVSLRDPGLGTISFDQGIGEVTFTPAENVNGEVAFIYTASNGFTESEGSATVTLENSADGFSAEGIGQTVVEDSVENIFVLGDLVENLVSEDGEAHISAVRMVANNDGSMPGRVTLNDEGEVQFIPAPDFSGEAAFEVRLSNGYERISVPVSVTVQGENDAPKVDDSAPVLETAEDIALDFHTDDLLAGTYDPEGNDVLLSDLDLVNQSQGQLTVNATGNVHFIPAESIHGDVPIRFTLTDSAGATREIETSITVVNENDVVELADRVLDPAIEDEPRTFSLEELLVGPGVIQTEDGQIDIDGDVLRVVNPVLSDPDAGELKIVANGDVVYTPSSDYIGGANREVSFTYLVDDGNTLSAPVTATFQIDTVNDAPEYKVGVPEFNAVEDTIFTFTVDELLTGAQDAEGDGFTLTEIGLVDETQGVLIRDTQTEKVRFTPAENINGEVALQFTLTDDLGASQAFISTLMVDSVNDTVELSDITLDPIDEDQSVTINRLELLQGLMQDADGETLSIVNPVLEVPEAGSISLNSQGDVVFIPSVDYTGNEDGIVAFRYQANDGVGVSEPVTARFAVTEENDAPIGRLIEIAGMEDMETVFSANDLLVGAMDPEGDAFQVTDVRLVDPEQGTLSFNATNGEIRLQTAPNFIGEAEFEYDLTEAGSAGLTSTHPGKVIVANGNDDDFTIQNSSLSLVEGQTTLISAAALFGAYAQNINAEGKVVESDGQILTLTDVQVRNAVGEPDTDLESKVTLAIGNDSQTIALHPSMYFHGQFQIRYTVTDGTHTHNTVIDTEVTPVNNAPVGVDHTGPLALPDGVEDTVYTLAPGQFLAGSFDVENDSYSLDDVRLQDTGQGSIGIFRDSDGIITDIAFSPTENIYGEVGFEYDLVELESGLTATHLASVHLTQVNDTVSLEDQGYQQEHDANHQVFNLFEDEERIYSTQELVGAVDARFDQAGQVLDVDDEALSIVGVEMKDTQTGSVELLDSGEVKFTPAENYVGEAAFVVSVHDGSEAEAVQAIMTVRMWPLNDGPVHIANAGDLQFSVEEEGELRIAGSEVLAQFKTDVEGESYRIVGPDQTDALGQASAHGEVIYDEATDEIVFRPEKDYFGGSTFQVVVEDESGAYQTVPVHVNVNNTPDVIAAHADHFILNEGEDRTFTVEDFIANDTNPDGDALDIVAIDDGGMEGGTVQLHTDGTVSYQPYSGTDSEWSGSQTFQYTVENSAGVRSTAQVRITVEDVNDAPTVESKTATLREDTAITFELNDLLANASDVEDDWMQITGVEVDSGVGEVHYDQAAGTVSFVPVEHFNSTLINVVDAEGNPIGPVKPLLRYQVTDENGAVTWGGVEMDVTPVNDAPRAGNDDLFVWSHGPNDYANPHHETEFFVNDVEVDGEHNQLLISDYTQGLHGTVTRLSDGTITYLADGGYTGEDTFRYTVTDGVTHEVWGESLDYESSDLATVDVHVIENHAPVTVGDVAATMDEDSIASLDLSRIWDVVYDQDMGHEALPETLSVARFENAFHIQNAYVEDDQLRFVFDDHYNSTQFEAPASLDVIVEDIVGNQTSVAVDFAVEQVNDAPVANSERIGEIQEDGAGLVFTIRDLLRNDKDVDRDIGVTADDFLLLDNIRVLNRNGEKVGSRESNDPGGIFQKGQHSAFDPDDYRDENGNFEPGLLDAAEQDYQGYLDNEFRFVPNENWNGNAPIRYTVSDSDDATDSITSTIRVNPENDIPILELKTPTDSGYDNGTRNEIAIRQLLSNSYDADGDSLNIVDVNPGGVVSNAYVSGGNVVWTANSPGSGLITYTVSDGVSGAEGRQSATINVSVEHAIVPPVITGVSSHVDPVYTTGPGDDGVPRVRVEGTVSATDPDAPDSTLKYYINSAGTVSFHGIDINTTTGAFSVTKSAPGRDYVVINESVRFYVVDADGSTTASNPVRIYGEGFSTGHGGGGGKPIVFDLDDDGVNLIGLEESNAHFQWDDDNELERTGWVGDGDGLLAYDHNQDGVINQSSEISFVNYLEGARTDLEGLAAFDTDGDQMFSANDENWEQFGVWQDDGDGHSEDGEFHTLGDAGIASISLYNNENQVFAEPIEDDGNIIHGESVFTRTDGSSGELVDVSLAYMDQETEASLESNDGDLEDSDNGESEPVSESSNVPEQEDQSSDQNDETSDQEIARDGDTDPFAEIDETELDRQAQLAAQDTASHVPPESEAATVVDGDAMSAGEDNMLQDDEELLAA